MKNAETTKDKLLKSIEDDGFFAAAVSSKTQLFQNLKVVHFFSKLSYQNSAFIAKRRRKNAAFDLRKNIVEKDFEPNLTY